MKLACGAGIMQNSESIISRSLADAQAKSLQSIVPAFHADA
jgi:hypothetical protein